MKPSASVLQFIRLMNLLSDQLARVPLLCLPIFVSFLSITFVFKVCC